MTRTVTFSTSRSKTKDIPSPPFLTSVFMMIFSNDSVLDFDMPKWFW